ncbi:hypothetical protein C8F04DRAFT_1269682 [Mycena alexandri]|uniref:Ribonuclease H1 N-terminal domain-containing protein n=1 Tax=Mycena alexandri TaxID=1745969 RepID=A0AAD6WU83_9AGAR|nr:hypothetical protein C8F04DRAFT_1269682 [Mycena alexandri]
MAKDGDEGLIDSARVYTDDEFAALIVTLSLSNVSVASPPRTQTPPPPPSPSLASPSRARTYTDDAFAIATLSLSDDVASPLTLARTQTPPLPQSPSRPLYFFESPTRSGYTSSWAVAGTATQGIPGGHVHAVTKAPKKKRTKKAAYTVFFGRVPGVFMTWAETKQLVDGVPNAIFRGYRTVAEAHAAYAYAHARSWMRVCGSALSSTPTPIPILPAPSTNSGPLNPLHGTEALNNTWYIVYRGVLPGVYHSNLEASLNTVGIGNALYESVEGREEAFRRYREAQAQRNRAISPPPSSYKKFHASILF